MVSGPNDELRLPCPSRIWIAGTQEHAAAILALSAGGFCFRPAACVSRRPAAKG